MSDLRDHCDPRATCRCLEWRASSGAAWVLALLVLTIPARPGKAREVGAPAGPKAYPVAIFPFEERGASVKQYGAQAGDILFARLVAEPGLVLVDRAELARTLQEQELKFRLGLGPLGHANDAEAAQLPERLSLPLRLPAEALGDLVP